MLYGKCKHFSILVRRQIKQNSELFFFDKRGWQKHIKQTYFADDSCYIDGIIRFRIPC